MHRVTVLFAALALGGCNNARRCADIPATSQLMAELLASARERKKGYVRARLMSFPVDARRAAQSAVTDTGLRRVAANYDNWHPATETISESALQLGVMEIHDSLLPPLPIPPRPSDFVWYEEHCYEGKPR